MILQKKLLTSTLALGTSLVITTAVSTNADAKTTTYKVKSGDSLYKIAQKYNTTYKKIMQWNNLSSTTILIGQQLVVSKSKNTQVPSKPSLENTSTYKVKSGDTLSAIGRKYNVTYQQLMSWNQLRSTVIYVGQKLTVNGENDTAVPIEYPKEDASSLTPSKSATYIVRAGDTLSKIASRYNMDYQKIMELNKLSSTTIYIGQKLAITGKVTTSSIQKDESDTMQVSKPQPTTSTNVTTLALKYLGVPYAFAGATPNGFDCSGFIYYIFKEAGLANIRTSSLGLYNLSAPVTNPKAGDLVFFSNTYKPGISHVGIYLGNNTMVHAGGNKVQISSTASGYWAKHFTAFKRYR